MPKEKKLPHDGPNSGPAIVNSPLSQGHHRQGTAPSTVFKETPKLSTPPHTPTQSALTKAIEEKKSSDMPSLTVSVTAPNPVNPPSPSPRYGAKTPPSPHSPRSPKPKPSPSTKRRRQTLTEQSFFTPASLTLPNKERNQPLSAREMKDDPYLEENNEECELYSIIVRNLLQSHLKIIPLQYDIHELIAEILNALGNPIVTIGYTKDLKEGLKDIDKTYHNNIIILKEQYEAAKEIHATLDAAYYYLAMIYSSSNDDVKSIVIHLEEKMWSIFGEAKAYIENTQQFLYLYREKKYVTSTDVAYSNEMIKTDISELIKPIITPILSHTTSPILTKTLNNIDYLYKVTRDVIAYYALTVNKSSFEEKLRENLLYQIQSVEFTSASYEDACKRILNVFKNTTTTFMTPHIQSNKTNSQKLRELLNTLYHNINKKLFDTTCNYNIKTALFSIRQCIWATLIQINTQLKLPLYYAENLEKNVSQMTANDNSTQDIKNPLIRIIKTALNTSPNDTNATLTKNTSQSIEETKPATEISLSSIAENELDQYLQNIQNTFTNFEDFTYKLKEIYEKYRWASLDITDRTILEYCGDKSIACHKGADYSYAITQQILTQFKEKCVPARNAKKTTQKNLVIYDLTKHLIEAFVFIQSTYIMLYRTIERQYLFGAELRQLMAGDLTSQADQFNIHHKNIDKSNPESIWMSFEAILTYLTKFFPSFFIFFKSILTFLSQSPSYIFDDKSKQFLTSENLKQCKDSLTSFLTKENFNMNLLATINFIQGILDDVISYRDDIQNYDQNIKNSSAIFKPELNGIVPLEENLQNFKEFSEALDKLLTDIINQLQTLIETEKKESEEQSPQIHSTLSVISALFTLRTILKGEDPISDLSSDNEEEPAYSSPPISSKTTPNILASQDDRLSNTPPIFPPNGISQHRKTSSAFLQITNNTDSNTYYTQESEKILNQLKTGLTTLISKKRPSLIIQQIFEIMMHIVKYTILTNPIKKAQENFIQNSPSCTINQNLKKIAKANTEELTPQKNRNDYIRTLSYYLNDDKSCSKYTLNALKQFVWRKRYFLKTYFALTAIPNIESFSSKITRQNLPLIDSLPIPSNKNPVIDDNHIIEAFGGILYASNFFVSVFAETFGLNFDKIIVPDNKKGELENKTRKLLKDMRFLQLLTYLQPPDDLKKLSQRLITFNPRKLKHRQSVCQPPKSKEPKTDSSATLFNLFNSPSIFDRLFSFPKNPTPPLKHHRSQSSGMLSSTSKTGKTSPPPPTITEEISLPPTSLFWSIIFPTKNTSRYRYDPDAPSSDEEEYYSDSESKPNQNLQNNH